MLVGAICTAAGMGLGSYLSGHNGIDVPVVSSAEAAGGKITGPNAVAPARYVYYPGTEILAKDEVRVIACGTGMPDQRRGQASACFLFEFGNGEKIIFDIGSGSAERLSAMKIPYDYLDKVFLGHLHSDHFGDLGALWIGGVIGNRIKPLRVWGPSGHKPEFGTKYATDRMKEMFTWDSGSRQGNVDIRGQVLDVTEFDYKAVNKVIYEENGVTIRSIPAIHAPGDPCARWSRELHP